MSDAWKFVLAYTAAQAAVLVASVALTVVGAVAVGWWRNRRPKA